MEFIVAVFVILIVLVGVILLKYYGSVEFKTINNTETDKLGYEHSDLLIDQYIELINSKDDIDVRLEKRNALTEKMIINYNARNSDSLVKNQAKAKRKLFRA